MEEIFFLVDAFTDHPFSGNPAGVVILKEEKSEEWMLSLAKEVNASETAFLLKQRSGYSLRWFTPEVEVNLYGHGTLAAAHVLYETGYVEDKSEIIFQTKSGELIVSIHDEWIRMEFPKIHFFEVGFGDEYINALGCEPEDMYTSGENLLVVFNQSQKVINFSPNFEKIKELDFQGVIITSQSDEDGVDFISRYFAPRVGVNEDPVTGSTQCTLGPYWRYKLEKDNLIARQASDRGGLLRVQVTEDHVEISGQAVTVFSGNLLC